MRLDRRVGVAAFPHAVAERHELLVEDLLLLLAHRPAQQVGLAQRVAGQFLRGALHLLLIDDQAVGRAEDLLERLLQLGVDRGDLLQLVLAQGVVGVRVGAHRAGPVERQHRGDVLEVVRFHQPQQRAHRTAVELEHAERVAAGEQLVGRLVVQRQRQQVEFLAVVELDVLDRVVDDRQVAQAQEVHLEQAERLAGRVVELRDDHAVGVPAHQRDVVDDRLGAHDHAGRVHAGLPDQALDAAGGVDDLLDVRVGVVQRAHLAGFAVPLVVVVEDAGQRDVLAHHRGRHRLGDPVADRVREAQHPGRVLDRGLGLDRAERGDLRDLVLAPPLGHVADDLAAPALVEVDVDIGHRDALGVEEPFEDQPVRDRVEVGDAHRVGDQRAGRRATARADRDALALGPLDEVGDHQEVGREAHLDDDAELVLGLLAGAPRGCRRGTAGAGPRTPPCGTRTPRSRPSGHREPGHQVLEGEHAGRCRPARPPAGCCGSPPATPRTSPPRASGRRT